MKKRTLFRDIGEIMTLEKAVQKNARGAMNESDLSVKKNSVLIVEDGQIVWVGSKDKIPKEYKKNSKEISLKGKNIFPGFIDCHTHSLFMGNRSDEFEKRNQGVTYQEIAAQGGGILSTVRATRKAKSDQIKKSFLNRMDIFLKQGVTSVEVKTGYGLSLKEELRLLEIAKKAKSQVKTTSTFLGAHARPPEFKTNQEYLLELQKGLKKIAKEKLAQRVDIFIEKNYFSVEEGRDFLLKAKDEGFDLVIHADQMTRTGASMLAVELGARSADHAICVTDKDIQALAASEVTCVLLPASDFYIHCDYPPARKMIDQGVRVALSTDFNPGTSPTQNIQLVGLLARLHMKMSLPEVFIASTLGSAFAIGLGQKRGALIPGYEADFFVSELSWREFFYDLNPNQSLNVWVNGNQKV